jgi:hypothetical protein
MLSIKGVELLRGGGGGRTLVLARNKGFNRRILLSEFVVAGAVALLLLSCLVHSRQLNELSESEVSDICSDFTPYDGKVRRGIVSASLSPFNRRSYVSSTQSDKRLRILDPLASLWLLLISQLGSGDPHTSICCLPSLLRCIL